MNINYYAYRVTWSSNDNEHVGLCAELPSLSWLVHSPEKALSGIRKVVDDVVKEMTASGESIPEPLSEKKDSGRFMGRIPAMGHRTLAT